MPTPMASIRRALILAHRYLGISLSLIFATWFVSGIAMIFAGGMPSLDPKVRLERLPVLDVGRIRIQPAEAASRAGMARPTRLTLLTVMGRPAYRVSGGDVSIVFADTGDVLDVGERESVDIASRFMNLPSSALRAQGVLDRPDQWTLEQRGLLPFHKFSVDDGARTELYVSEVTGEVAQMTTRGTRLLAWAAAIPHWMYLAPLRSHERLWRQVVLWTSGLGIASVAIGLVLAVWQARARYTRWMRWHYVAGVTFGVFALTWVFSGFLSMEPFDWASGGPAPVTRISQTLGGGPLDLAAFPPIDPEAWSRALGGRRAKEIEFRRTQGDPYYVVRETMDSPLLIAASSLQPRPGLFSVASIVDRLSMTGAPIAEATPIAAYDAYYYDRDRDAPLPVVRVKFDDPAATWVYVDERTGQLVALFTRRGRVNRWLYHGLHSLDFPFWYDNSAAWHIGVIGFCAGGACLSLTAVVIAFRRLFRRRYLSGAR